MESEELNLTSNVKLIGMDDSCKEILDNYENSLKKIDDELSSDKFNIMLIHKPDYYFKFNLQNVDLMISGHTHGGQWRIPFILNGLIAPGQGFLPKYAGGMYDEDYTLIVSRGLSKEKTIIPRLFNRPEINLIKLKPTVKSF